MRRSWSLGLASRDHDWDRRKRIGYRDAIATRNAVGGLWTILNDAGVKLDDYQVWQLCEASLTVAIGITIGYHDVNMSYAW